MNDAARLTPVLVHIQSHLDQDLSLERLAALSGLSPFHFHRIFREAVGETVKQYTMRLRLERAAYWLKIQDSPIVEVAFQMGFKAHETFSRAFKRQFGQTPKQYRQHHFVSKRVAQQKPTQLLNQYADQVNLSRVRVVKLQPLKVGFIRNFGAYELVDHTLYEQLIEWAIETGQYGNDSLLLGVGHDDPTITSTEKVRFDVCIAVNKPFVPNNHIGYQELPSGYYAMLTYVGPWDKAMYASYAKLYQTVRQLEGYTLIGLPVIEIYRMTQINPDYALNHCDIYLPVEKLAS